MHMQVTLFPRTRIGMDRNSEYYIRRAFVMMIILLNLCIDTYLLQRIDTYRLQRSAHMAMRSLKKRSIHHAWCDWLVIYAESREACGQRAKPRLGTESWYCLMGPPVNRECLWRQILPKFTEAQPASGSGFFHSFLNGPFGVDYSVFPQLIRTSLDSHSLSKACNETFFFF